MKQNIKQRLACASIFLLLVAEGKAQFMTGWQMIDEGQSVVNVDFTTWPVAFTYAQIPSYTDPRWIGAPNAATIGFSRGSRVPSCDQGLDFTYFQTTVFVPTNLTVNQFKWTISGEDDASLVYVFNDTYPNGAINSTSYDYSGSSGNGDMTQFLMPGQANRIVIVHADYCPSGNTLSACNLSLNGTGLPIINLTSEPQSITTNSGAVVNFSFGVQSSGSWFFNWYFNGILIPNATSSVLTLTDVQATNSGYYQAVATNSSTSFSISSDVATLVVVPQGAPNLFVNSNLASISMTVDGAANISFTPGFTNGLILYTLDGDDPLAGDGYLYSGPFVLTNSCTISAVCFSADFSQYAEMLPCLVQVVEEYTLLGSVMGPGILSFNPSNNLYVSNSTVQVVAASTNSNWSFQQWQGAANSTNNPVSIVINNNTNIIAVFTQSAFGLYTFSAGGGSVSVTGQTADGTNFTANSLATISAANNNGWTFLSWQGALSGTNNPATLLVTNSASIQAVFGTSVLTNAVGGGVILLNSKNFIGYGSNVTASAIASNGTYFVAWGGVGHGTSSPLLICVTNPLTTVEALFLNLPTTELSLSVGVIGDGWVQIEPQSQVYHYGDEVTLTALAGSSNSPFYGWQGSCNYTNATTAFTLYTNSVVYAYFQQPPSNVLASAMMLVTNGSCFDAQLTGGGSDYGAPPTVTIVGGGGTGATATAILQNGTVVAINITNPGSGYTNAPSIIIEPPVIATPTVSVSPASFLTFSNLISQNNYLVEKADGQNWDITPDVILATNITMSVWVNGFVQPNSYRAIVTPLPVTATATAITSYGFVVSAVVTSGGSGYMTAPGVAIYGGGGSGAQATTTVSNGVVVGVAIVSPGSGYTNPPTITISAPPISGGIANVTRGVLLSEGNLMTNQMYQVQTMTVLPSIATNTAFGLFVATNTSQSQYLLATNAIQLFRTQYVP